MAPFAEARAVVEIAPWNGDSLNDDYPEAPVRTLTFEPAYQGLLTYLILDDQRRIDLLDVLWLR